jgi:hypothetical protein
MNELIQAIALIAELEGNCAAEQLLIIADAAARASKDSTRSYTQRRDFAVLAKEAMQASKRARQNEAVASSRALTRS